MDNVNEGHYPPTFQQQINKKVGAFLRQRRLALSLSGHELGDILHLSQQQISRYERGVTTITLPQLVRFIQVLGCSWVDFFSEVMVEQSDSTFHGSSRSRPRVVLGSSVTHQT